jgi:uncharacterized membrane protein
MSGVPLDAIATAAHQVGVLIWVGGLFFTRLVWLPATATLKAPMERMRLRFEAYKRLFLSGWVGMLLVWGSGLWRAGSLEVATLPIHVQVMAGAALAMVLLYLIAFLALYLNLGVAIEEDRLIRAARNNFWLRKLIWANLILGLAAAVAGAAWPHLPA